MQALRVAAERQGLRCASSFEALSSFRARILVLLRLMDLFVFRHVISNLLRVCSTQAADRVIFSQCRGV